MTRTTKVLLYIVLVLTIAVLSLFIVDNFKKEQKYLVYNVELQGVMLSQEQIEYLEVHKLIDKNDAKTLYTYINEIENSKYEISEVSKIKNDNEVILKKIDSKLKEQIDRAKVNLLKYTDAIIPVDKTSLKKNVRLKSRIAALKVYHGSDILENVEYNLSVHQQIDRISAEIASANNEINSKIIKDVKYKFDEIVYIPKVIDKTALIPEIYDFTSGDNMLYYKKMDYGLVRDGLQETGLTIIAGHNYSFFKNLKNIKDDSVLIIENIKTKNTTKYKLVEKGVIDEYQVDMVYNSKLDAKKYIVTFTCENSYEDRLNPTKRFYAYWEKI